ncbi:MAG: helix-turn-helix domain-containing protein [Dactylosporangium sp.]|nr:helix-turn-helix domain-containing protein [Dactylosporangium sp.]
MAENNNPTTEWTAERVAALGLVTDLVTAAAILRLSRSSAYELAKAGQFPVPLLRAGRRYRVPVAALLDVLHLRPPARLDPAAEASVDHYREISRTAPQSPATPEEPSDE